MKTKLTLTIEKGLLPKAKRIARRNKVSLSQLVEKSLMEFIDTAAVSFTEKWKGRFKESSRDSDRYRYLAKRYL